jgi:hypothetical protein
LETVWKIYKKINFHAKMEQIFLLQPNFSVDKDNADKHENPPMTPAKRRQF